MVKDRLHILLPRGYKRALKITAAKAAISMSGLIQQAIDEYFIKRSSKDGSKTNDEDA
jgi:hypothetical protein